jgi:hypothetical protein
MLCAVMVPTLGLKVSGTVAQFRAKHDVTDAVAMFFKEHGFEVAAGHSFNGLRFDIMTRNACRLHVANIDADGTHAHVVARSASPGERVWYVYSGQVHQAQPRWRSLTDYYWRQINLRLGRVLPVRPVLGVIASPACEPDVLPWAEIGKIG